MTALPLILTVFVACAVEAIEALTIVLAAGLTREWRSTFQGMAVALAVLAAIVAALGPTDHAAAADRAAAGGRRAAGHLRAAVAAQGHPARYRVQVAARRGQRLSARGGGGQRLRRASSRGRVHDWYAFTLAFKGVLLEGLEVVFIVITFGANQRDVGAAVIGAAAAVAVVAVTGVLVRAPLARVPENAMKFAVGIMLTSFGIFWGAEGAGVSWPGQDAALLVLVPVVALVALCYTVLLRPRRGRSPAEPATEQVVSS